MLICAAPLGLPQNLLFLFPQAFSLGYPCFQASGLRSQGPKAKSQALALSVARGLIFPNIYAPCNNVATSHEVSGKTALAHILIFAISPWRRHLVPRPACHSAQGHS